MCSLITSTTTTNTEDQSIPNKQASESSQSGTSHFLSKVSGTWREFARDSDSNRRRLRNVKGVQEFKVQNEQKASKDSEEFEEAKQNILGEGRLLSLVSSQQILPLGFL